MCGACCQDYICVSLSNLCLYKTDMFLIKGFLTGLFIYFGWGLSSPEIFVRLSMYVFLGCSL